MAAHSALWMIAVVLSVGLAGCSVDEAENDPSDGSAQPASPPETRVPITRDEALVFDYIRAADSVTMSDNCLFARELPSLVVEGLVIEASWESSPLLGDLELIIDTMIDPEGLRVRGASPLRLDVPSFEVPSDGVVRIFLQTPVEDPAGAAYDQRARLTVTGTATGDIPFQIAACSKAKSIT